MSREWHAMFDENPVTSWEMEHAPDGPRAWIMLKGRLFGWGVNGPYRGADTVQMGSGIVESFRQADRAVAACIRVNWKTIRAR